MLEASGLVLLVTATRCFAGSTPLSDEVTSIWFVSVSSVVPDFETRTKSVVSGSMVPITAAASSGSTLEMNFALRCFTGELLMYSASAR